MMESRYTSDTKKILFSLVLHLESQSKIYWMIVLHEGNTRR